ncbi:MAG TPA: beta-L-arabinofuranosidase domain-containing protein [Actinomycetales bacterium]
MTTTRSARTSPPATSGSDPLERRSRPVRIAQLLPLHAVRLTEGPLRDAQQRAVDYVLALDVDRLAAPYRREAGLPAVSDGYGNWEGDGMGGHIGGHYLSACSLLVASTGDERVGRRLGRLLDELQQCHDARADGYLGGVPDGAALADELAGGRIEADLFDLNGRWVPLYNLHKTLAGLVDAVVHAGEERALHLATDLADWWVRTSAHLDDAQVEAVLHTEPGGMTEALSTLGALTGDERYLLEARRLLHQDVLRPLLEGRDALDGLHANTQIPKVVGYEVLGQLTADASLTGAAETFWQHVVRGRTVAIGGNSVREHFHAADDFTSMVIDREGPEGCNTVNMVELSVLQYLRTGRPDLVDYVERALFNHVLASQHPGHGGLVYFTPMRPAHYRVYSQPETSMWCCVGSGMEAHSRHGAFVAVRGQLPGTTRATLDVLLHVGADITDVASGLRVCVRPERLGAGRVTVTVERAVDALPGGAATDTDAGTGAGAKVLRLRRPSWAPAASARVVGGGADVHVDAGDPDWFVVHLGVSALDEGVVLELDLPAGVRSEPLPDGSPWAALVHGPLVLAAGGERQGLTGLLAGEARMGHVAAGALVPLAETPVLADPPDARVLADGVVTVTGWVATEHGERETEVRLQHLAQVHDQRYTVYWPTGDPSTRRGQLRAMDAAECVDVIDEVAAGEQQPESDHHLVGSRSSAGRQGTLHWRSATGWFSYVLRDPEAAGRRLVVRYRDATGWGDTVHVDGEPCTPTAIEAAPDGCLEQTFVLAPAGSTTPGTRVVLIRADDAVTTREVVAVRLLR